MRLLSPITTVDAKISIFRGNEEYIFLTIIDKKHVKKSSNFSPAIGFFLNPLNYKKEKVLLVGETGAQSAIPINSNLRPSLSNAIFSGSVLNSVYLRL